MRYRMRGQSLVEFALVVPFIILIVMGIIDFGYYIYTYSELENATRRASEFASKTAPTSSTCKQLAKDEAKKSVFLSNLADTDITVNASNETTLRNPVEVRINYQGQFLTPVARRILGNGFTFNLTSRRTIVSNDAPLGSTACP